LARRFFVAGLEAVLVVTLTALIEVGEDAILELALLLERVIRCFSLRNAQVTAAARASELAHHHLEPLGPVLGTVMNAFGKVSDRAFGHGLAFGVRVRAFDHVPNLIEVMPVTRCRPASGTGAADVQQVVVGIAIASGQQELLFQDTCSHVSYHSGLSRCWFTDSHVILLANLTAPMLIAGAIGRYVPRPGAITCSYGRRAATLPWRERLRDHG